MIVDVVKSIKCIADMISFFKSLHSFLPTSTIQKRWISIQEQHKVKLMEIERVSDTRWSCQAKQFTGCGSAWISSLKFCKTSLTTTEMLTVQLRPMASCYRLKICAIPYCDCDEASKSRKVVNIPPDKNIAECKPSSKNNIKSVWLGMSRSFY